MDVDKTMLDELTRDCKTPEDVEKLYSQMLQHMINRALEGEMQAHLGHERHGRSSGNVRNGKSRKQVQSKRPPTPHSQHCISAASLHANHAG